MTKYIITQPTEADADGLINMHVRSWLVTYPSEENGVSEDFVRDRVKRFTTSEGQEKRRDYIRESYSNPDYYLRVAKDETGTVVGFVDARRGATNELCGLYIDSSAYGSGLATELAEPALEWLGKGKDIMVTVVAYNGRAQAFYRKLGFALVAGSERPYKDTPIRVVDMVRKSKAEKSSRES